jgi:hypothetical protein
LKPGRANFRVLYPAVFHTARPHPRELWADRHFNYENALFEMPLMPLCEAVATEVDETAQCNCAQGGVRLSVKGEVLSNVLDHSEAASRALGTSPVQLCTVESSGVVVTGGSELLKRSTSGAVTLVFCGRCACHMYQTTEGASGTAVYPATFHIETPDKTRNCGASSILPSHLQPTAHTHYGQRVCNWDDGLPKHE